jgi:hypothetical protein
MTTKTEVPVKREEASAIQTYAKQQAGASARNP